MEPAVFVCEHVRKVYPGGRVGLDGISFTVAPGEAFGLLGPNGAGKTTLIRILAGLLRPTSGCILVMGRSPEDPEVRLNLGVVTQENTLDPQLTARQNLIMHAAYFGVPPKVAASRADWLLERFLMSGSAHERPRALSGGMRRKLMLARALITNPKVLVLDEPTVGLDLPGRRQLWSEVEAFRDRGGTVLMATHHLEEAERLCRAVAILHQGRLVASGKPSTLVRRSEQACVVAAGASRPPRQPWPPFVLAVEQRAEGLRIRFRPAAARPGQVAAWLLEAGISVTSFMPAEITLEDVVDELTTAPRTPGRDEVPCLPS